ncbi:hypothetical protein Q9966_000437 [Columba livia]|nr:hypothetical protein Q9966_000437 [Columba livia]
MRAQGPQRRRRSGERRAAAGPGRGAQPAGSRRRRASYRKTLFKRGKGPFCNDEC